jgi:hypothetical protein
MLTAPHVESRAGWLLDGEDAGQVLDRSAALSMTAFQLWVSIVVARDSNDVGNAMTLPFWIASRTPVQRAGQLPYKPLFAFGRSADFHGFHAVLSLLGLTLVVFCR